MELISSSKFFETWRNLAENADVGKDKDLYIWFLQENKRQFSRTYLSVKQPKLKLVCKNILLLVKEELNKFQEREI